MGQSLRLINLIVRGRGADEVVEGGGNDPLQSAAHARKGGSHRTLASSFPRHPGEAYGNAKPGRLMNGRRTKGTHVSSYVLF